MARWRPARSETSRADHCRSGSLRHMPHQGLPSGPRMKFRDAPLACYCRPRKATLIAPCAWIASAPVPATTSAWQLPGREASCSTIRGVRESAASAAASTSPLWHWFSRAAFTNAVGMAAPASRGRIGSFWSSGWHLPCPCKPSKFRWPCSFFRRLSSRWRRRQASRWVGTPPLFGKSGAAIPMPLFLWERACGWPITAITC